MKVSLIFTINELNINFQAMSFRDESFGYVPPLSLMTVASILEKEGVEVQLIDMDAEELTYSQTIDKLARFSPNLLGFTISTASFHISLKWIKKFKEDTRLPIMVGGSHLTLYPQETMTHSEIDYAIIGEAEIPLPQFVKAFQNGDTFDGIKSLAYRKDGNVMIENSLQMVKDLNSLPFPSRHLIKNELYSNILTKRKNFTAMLSSRGCPYRCAFCDQKNSTYRWRSAENFVDEIKQNYQRYGIREFDIYDTTFTVNQKRVLAICEKIIEENLDVGWTVRSRVDSVDEQTLNALKKAGCHTIFYGIESSNPDILKRMRKDISIDRMEYIVDYTKKLGIDTLGYFLFGFPGETRKTVEDTINFSLKLPLDYAQFSVLVPMPATEIYQYYREHGLEDYWSIVTLEPERNFQIDLIGTELTKEEMNRYVEIANRKFYYRFKIIFKQLLRIKSFKSFQRRVKGALNLLKQ